MQFFFFAFAFFIIFRCSSPPSRLQRFVTGKGFHRISNSKRFSLSYLSELP